MLGEFTAKKVQKYFDEKKMEHFCMYTSPKLHVYIPKISGMAKRANRTIKERLYRYFPENHTQKWIDVIQDIVRAINHSYNSTIGMAPVDVTFENAEAVRQKIAADAYANRPKRSPRFRVGDRVRIKKHKHVFQKGYTPRFTSEVFTVAEMHSERSPVVYPIRDDNGEMIKGWFYANDLCRVIERPSKDHLTDIGKVLRKQRKEGVDYLLLK